MPLSEIPLPADAIDELPLVRSDIPGPSSHAFEDRLTKVEYPAVSSRRKHRSESSSSDFHGIVFATGRGANVYDVDNNRYVDLVAGFGSLVLGHCAKPVVRAIQAQSERLTMGLGDVYATDSKAVLLEKITRIFPTSNAKTILCQSGSDAITAAIKTAMLATQKPRIVAFEGAYHGMGYAPLAGCGLRESYRAPFQAQLNGYVDFIPYPSIDSEQAATLDALDTILKKGDVGAILVEPVLGRGGIVIPPQDFLPDLTSRAHAHGALVIADEIWTGMGRSGAMLRSVVLGADVDIVCIGKGLGGGMPISACIAKEEIMAAWATDKEVLHTSTHAAHPLACAAAIATMDTIKSHKLCQRASALGEYFLTELREELASVSKIRAIRGVGMMFGIECDSAATAQHVMKLMLKQGYILLTGGVNHNVLTLTPALTIREEILMSSIAAFEQAFSTLNSL